MRSFDSGSRDNDSPGVSTSSSKLENNTDEEVTNGTNNNGNATPIDECNSQVGNDDPSTRIEPPALPPRPPNLSLSGSHLPHPPHAFTSGQQQQSRTGMTSLSTQCQYTNLNSDAQSSCFWRIMARKYILLCCLCGGLTFTIGVLYLVIFFIVKNYTTSLQYFQTMPLYIPSVVLIVTGLLVILFSKRRNRNSYLIKITGCFCLCSAVLCVVVTVTTTVVHMNRLQTLRECVYQGSTQTCTCFSAYLETGLHPLHHHDPTLRFIFAGTPDCEVIHGILYSCLRALFGLSVIGILVCIFSCMLVYQLLSHEKKKKYWEQLEQRCRHLYRRNPVPRNGHYTVAGSNGLSSLLLDPSSLRCQNLINSGPLTANTTMTNLSNCGYCHSEDGGYPGLAIPLSCSSGPFSVASGTGVLNNDNYGCPWPTPAVWDAIQDDRFFSRSNFGSGACGNLYTPNPVETCNMLTATVSNSNAEAINASQNGGQMRASWSLRSFRSWLPWSSSTQSSSSAATTSANSGDNQACGPSAVQIRPADERTVVNPRWRYSNPDSQYGFRTTSFLHAGQIVPYPPHQQQWRCDNVSTPYTLSEQIPRYLWGPPPPYSQPPSLENIREATSPTSQQNIPQVSSPASGNVAVSPTSPNGHTSSQLQSGLARTTKSGLLLRSSDFRAESNINHSLQTAMSVYDESIKSAVHVYEQANEIRRKSNNYCNSLPTRRPKKKTGNERSLAGFKSTANLPEAILSNKSETESRLQKFTLNQGATNQISNYKKQSLPLPPIPAPKPKISSDVYRPSSVISRSSCSTTENKYETIGKRLHPYKVSETSGKHFKPFSGFFNSKNSDKPSTSKTGQRSSVDSGSYSSSPDSDQGYGFVSMSSVSPMSIDNNSSSADSTNSGNGVSSHYAQLSPLRGEGLPPASRMGLQNSSSFTNPNSPVKSYFQVLQRQSANSASSLPNVNTFAPLTSPQSYTPVQQPQREMCQDWNENRCALNSSEPPNLNTPTPIKMSQNEKHSNPLSSGFGFMKSRFYSASSETVNTQNVSKLNNKNDISYLVSPPPHYPSQLKRFSPFFNQNFSQLSTHKSLENLEEMEQKTSTQLNNSGPFSHQRRLRPLYSHNNPYTGNKDETGLPVARGCVYLRPEQNIPDVFKSTNFKPINENDDEKVDESCREIGVSNKIEGPGSGERTISRNDIVVTMRSVNV